MHFRTIRSNGKYELLKYVADFISDRYLPLFEDGAS